jgi:hypothetical protein
MVVECKQYQHRSLYQLQGALSNEHTCIIRVSPSIEKKNICMEFGDPVISIAVDTFVMRGRFCSKFVGVNKRILQKLE